VNGRRVADPPKRDDGLMAVPVSEGPVDLTVDWTTTADVVIGRWLSGTSLLLIAGLWLLGLPERRAARPRLS
jgi:hypothetical protein